MGQPIRLRGKVFKYTLDRDTIHRRMGVPVFVDISLFTSFQPKRFFRLPIGVVSLAKLFFVVSS
ncbi:hypothetical protein HNO89_003805 [Sporosarcina luteola]|nr:hypothetical protein [Sporosarcina luteola]